MLTATKQSTLMTPQSTGKTVVYRLDVFGAGLCPDAADVAKLHVEVLPRSPLSKLGAGFLRRFYYRQLPKQGYVFGAVAYVAGRPAGFVSATYDSRGMVQQVVQQNFFRLLLVGLTTLPTLRKLDGMLEAWSVFRARARSAKRHRPGPYGEILSFGVREPYLSSEFIANTGIDIQKDLIRGVLDGFRRSNLDRVRMIVDRDDIATRGFFQMLGFKVHRQLVSGWFTPSAELTWNPKEDPARID